MQCSKCDGDAVMGAPYAGTHLCESHFLEWVEKRIRRRIRSDGLMGDATSEDPATWVVGLSGGKDSVVLATVLSETFAVDPRVELVALTIHEGIEGYRDASLEACQELVASLEIPHKTVSYADEFGIRMDDVAAVDPENMAPCAYCGVFRRDVLERYAERLDANLLFTGHNLDDEAQTALMNLFEGDVTQMAKHFDASLGPLPERVETMDFVPRAKPLRDVPEKEVALYAHLRDLPAHMATCPHASEAYRGEVRDLLLSMEEDHPGTRHSIMAGYEDLAALAAEKYRRDVDQDITACEKCGTPTTGDRCRKCALLASIEAA